jgi:hypothetical protein
MRRKYALIVAISTLIMITLYGRIDYKSPSYSQWDLKHYLAMARAAPGIDATIPQPFAHRILGPFAAGLLPVSPETGFHILVILSSLFLALFFYFLLVTFDISPPAAAVGTILFVCNKYFFGFPIWDYFQINDILLLIGISVSFYALLKDKWVLLMSALLIGTLARETIFLMMPVPFLYLAEKGTIRQEGLKAMAAIIPALTVFLILRLLIPAPGNGPMATFMEHSGKIISSGFWYGLLINAIAPCSSLPIVFWKETVLFFKERNYFLIFLIMVFAAVLFGSNNERLMAPAFIVIYWLIARIIQRYVYPNVFFMAGLIGLGFISSFDYESGLLHLPNRTLSLAVPFAALCLLTMIAVRKNIGLPAKI